MNTLYTPDRALMWLRKTPVILSAILRDVDQTKAMGNRDGDDGWNVLEIMCHLNDLEDVYNQRLRATLEQDRPALIGFKPLEAVIEHDYAHQIFSDVVQSYLVRRTEKLRLLESLSAEQWQRVGVHADYGDMRVLDQAVATALHDVNHTEQIVRVLNIASIVL